MCEAKLSPTNKGGCKECPRSRLTSDQPELPKAQTLEVDIEAFYNGTTVCPRSLFLCRSSRYKKDQDILTNDHIVLQPNLRLLITAIKY